MPEGIAPIGDSIETNEVLINNSPLSNQEPQDEIQHKPDKEFMLNESSVEMDHKIEDRMENRIKDRVSCTYADSCLRIKYDFGIVMTPKELIYLHNEAKKAVMLDEGYREERLKLEAEGVKEDDPRYEHLEFAQPNLTQETIEGWLENYLGIEPPQGGSHRFESSYDRVTPITYVLLPKDEWKINSSGNVGKYKSVDNSHESQLEAHSIARRTRASHGGKESIDSYFIRSDYRKDPTFKEYVLRKLEQRRAESEVSDLN